jgi:general secretion pathway protein G
MTRKNQRRPRRSGFTLLEVLLVLAILVIMASTVTVYFAKTQTSANIKAARVQINAVSQRLDQYRIDVGTYPNSQQGLNALSEAPSDLNQSDKWAGPYVQRNIPADPWGNPYQYKLENADQFMVYSLGPDGQENSEDDVTPL